MTPSEASLVHLFSPGLWQKWRHSCSPASVQQDGCEMSQLGRTYFWMLPIDMILISAPFLMKLFVV